MKLKDFNPINELILKMNQRNTRFDINFKPSYFPFTTDSFYSFSSRKLIRDSEIQQKVIDSTKTQQRKKTKTLNPGSKFSRPKSP